jgi:hypothetical protein
MSTTIIPEVQDIVDSADERELWIVGREFERPPYFHAGKGGDTRLARALRVCVDGRITPNSDGSYTVEGSEHRTYRVGDSCSCPQSQKGQSRWCYHAVAVALYVEWQKRLRPRAPTFSPVVLGTLRAGTAPVLPITPDEDDAPGNGFPVDDETLPLPLPLPPTTIDERLAAGPHATEDRLAPAAAVARDHVYDALPTPQEDLMTEDAEAYIPEPPDGFTATEADFPRFGAAATAPDGAPGQAVEEPPAPAPLRIPREYTVSIKGRVHVLYTGLVLAARTQGLLTLAADWTYNDAELSLAHAVCTFADGRRYEDSGDATPANVSKGIATHFRRVALTRAKARCLRDALGISECSVEELEDDTPKREVPDMSPASTDKRRRQRIWSIVKERAPQVTTREGVEAWVFAHTGLTLHPDRYAEIAQRLVDVLPPLKEAL